MTFGCQYEGPQRATRHLTWVMLLIAPTLDYVMMAWDAYAESAEA